MPGAAKAATISYKSRHTPHPMIPLISQHSDQLAEICQRHHVKRLEVFGSAAVGDAPPKPWYGNHIDLKEDLESLFNRTVDLIDDTAIKNPYFRKSVDETREQIYAARP